MAANAPTGDEIYNRARLKWNRLGISGGADLAEQVSEAVSYIQQVTGRYFDDQTPPRFDGTTTPPLSYYGIVTASTPAPLSADPNLYSNARRAVFLRSVQIVLHDQAGYQQSVAEDYIQSFSAGPYSESRHDPTRRGESRMINPWQELNDLLWLLLTEDRYSFWVSLLQNVHTPGFEVTEVDWGLIGKDVFLGSLAGRAPWWN